MTTNDDWTEFVRLMERDPAWRIVNGCDPVRWTSGVYTYISNGMFLSPHPQSRDHARVSNIGDWRQWYERRQTPAPF